MLETQLKWTKLTTTELHLVWKHVLVIAGIDIIEPQEWPCFFMEQTPETSWDSFPLYASPITISAYDNLELLIVTEFNTPYCWGLQGQQEQRCAEPFELSGVWKRWKSQKSGEGWHFSVHHQFPKLRERLFVDLIMYTSFKLVYMEYTKCSCHRTHDPQVIQHEYLQ